MLCAALLLACLATTRGYVTEQSFAERLDKLYEKLEKFNVTPESKLYAKLERLNSLTPDRQLIDEEELVTALQLWGTMSEDQLRGVVQELQQLKVERSEKLIDDYADSDWNDDDDPELSDLDYANDVGEEWDPIEDDISSTARPMLGVTPSAFTRLDGYRHTIVSAVDPIAATNERPRILDDSQATAEERVAIRKGVLTNMASVVRAYKCLTPQPRWLTVRKLAPAADTVYTPPCVQLHRCAPDSGCCYNEAEVCAPVDGKYVAIPFFLNKADGNLTAARMLFFNHTRCACVSKDTLQSTARTRLDRIDRIDRPERPDRKDRIDRTERTRDFRERQNDWRPPTEEPSREEDQTSPPLLKRCACPGFFRSRISNGACTCACDWAEASKRRDCLSLGRGREHFGLRDRLCIARGECAPPACEHGAYERHAGRCPLRRYRRRYRPRRA